MGRDMKTEQRDTNNKKRDMYAKSNSFPGFGGQFDAVRRDMKSEKRDTNTQKRDTNTQKRDMAQNVLRARRLRLRNKCHAVTADVTGRLMASVTPPPALRASSASRLQMQEVDPGVCIGIEPWPNYDERRRAWVNVYVDVGAKRGWVSWCITERRLAASSQEHALRVNRRQSMFKVEQRLAELMGARQ